MEEWKGTAIIITLASPSHPCDTTPRELECTDDKGECSAHGENFLQLKDGSSAKPRKGFKMLKKHKTKTKRAHIYQLRSAATTTRCGEERKFQESYENINNAPEAPLPTKPVMVWDPLTIIHREREEKRCTPQRVSKPCC